MDDTGVYECVAEDLSGKKATKTIIIETEGECGRFGDEFLLDVFFDWF